MKSGREPTQSLPAKQRCYHLLACLAHQLAARSPSNTRPRLQRFALRGHVLGWSISSRNLEDQSPVTSVGQFNYHYRLASHIYHDAMPFLGSSAPFWPTCTTTVPKFPNLLQVQRQQGATRPGVCATAASVAHHILLLQFTA